jgi:hypothetical protein
MAAIRIAAIRIAITRIAAAMPDVLEISATFLVVTIRRQQVTTAPEAGPMPVGLTKRYRLSFPKMALTSHSPLSFRMEMVAGRTMGLHRNVAHW